MRIPRSREADQVMAVRELVHKLRYKLRYLKGPARMYKGMDFLIRILSGRSVPEVGYRGRSIPISLLRFYLDAGKLPKRYSNLITVRTVNPR